MNQNKKQKQEQKNSKRLFLNVNSQMDYLQTLFLLYQKDRVIFESSIKFLISNPISFQYAQFQSDIFQHNLHRTPYIVTSKDVRQVIFLILEILNKSSRQVQNYVKCKRDIENFILLGQYSHALNILNEHKSEFGISYWYFENLFGIYSLQDNKLEAYKIYEYYSNMMTETESRDLNLLLERSNKSVSAERFDFISNSLIDSIAQDTIERKIINFMFNFDASCSYDIKSALDFSLKLNLPDVYNIISRSLAYLSVDQASHYTNICKLINTSRNTTNSDFFLKNILKSEHWSFDYIECLTLYLSGKNLQSKRLSISQIKSNPRSYIYFDIFTKSSALSNDTYTFTNVIEHYLSSCTDFLLSYKIDDLDSAIKISQQFNSMNCLQYVNTLKSKEHYSFLDDKPKKIKRFLYLLSLIENTDSFDLELNSHINKLRSSNNNSFPTYRLNKWMSDSYFELEKFDIYLEKITNYEGYPPHMMNEIIEKTIYSKYKMGRLDDVIFDIVSLLVKKDIMLKANFISVIYDQSKYCFEKISEITLIFNFILYKSKLIALQKLALYCDSFLKINSLNSFESYVPSDIFGNFILTKVITLDLIKKQRMKFKSDPLVVRATVLKNADKAYPLSDTDRREIDRLVREYARKISLVNIGNGKLYLNEDFLTHEMYQALFDDFLAIDNSVNLEKDSFSTLTIESPETKSHELAVDFLFKARDIYAVNEKFGIENSLNTHFRHNSIVPTLRAPLVRNRLECSLLSGEYTNNKMLEDRFIRSLKKQPYDELQTFAKLLSSKIDTTLNFLKDTYLHIYLNDLQDKQMLFKYEISKEDAFTFISLINAGSTYEDMLTWCVSLFNKKTEQLLKVGRDFICHSLCSDLLHHVNDFKEKLEKFIGKDDLIFKSISELEADIIKTCNDVSEWFSFIKQVREDFQISVPIEEAIEFVRKTNPHKEILLDIHMDHNYLVKGSYLFSLINIFIILFQNAVKSNREKCNINVDIKESEDKYLTINVSNLYDITNLEKVIEISSNIRKENFLKGAKENSGSGIYKVYRLMQIEMRNVKNVSININEGNKKLSVEWTMSTGFKERL